MEFFPFLLRDLLVPVVSSAESMKENNRLLMMCIDKTFVSLRSFYSSIFAKWRRLWGENSAKISGSRAFSTNVKRLCDGNKKSNLIDRKPIDEILKTYFESFQLIVTDSNMNRCFFLFIQSRVIDAVVEKKFNRINRIMSGCVM